MTRGATATTAITEIGEALKGHEPFGSVQVIDVSGELGTDQDDEPVLRLRLVVSDPAEGHGTWPGDDVFAMQLEADRLAREAAVELPYVVTEFYPQSPDPAEDGGDAGSGDVGELADALGSDETS